MSSTDEMIRVNRQQAEFYDAIHAAEADKGHGGYADNQEANFFTRAWAELRYRQQAALNEAGVEARVNEAHERWVREKAGGDFFELGCFSGSPSTFTLVANAGSYLGIELSPKAVVALNQKFATLGVAHKARAVVGDFLTMPGERKFDLLYAHGVLHHFEDPDPMFAKLAAIAKPGALLIFVEPSAVNPIYRMIRTAYRPFQSDASWEWPFSRRTVAALERHFESIDGFGWGRWSLPLSILTALPLLGRVVTPLYVRTVKREVGAALHSNLWRNSMVTAMFRLRD